MAGAKKVKGPVIVTGGAGFIGSHVAQELLKRGYRVVVLDDLSGGFEENVPTGAIFVKGSVTDEKLINELFRKYRFQYVFHFAAYAAEGLSHFIRCFNYENNVLGSVRMINAAINYGVKCFVFTSSIAVYGKNQLPMKESLVPNPEDPYGIAKYAVELDLRAAHDTCNLPYIIFRPHNVYGERQHIGDKYRNVLGIFLNNAMQGKPFTIFGDGKQKRAFTYIGDIAPVIARSVETKKAYNQVFNIGADTPYTVLELARIIAKTAGVPLKIKHLKARNEVKMAYSDHTKVRRVFKTKEYTALKEGVARMAAWAKQVGPRPRSIFGKIEVSKFLPPSWKIRLK
jgi:UDP-glucose 4-epimerase